MDHARIYHCVPAAAPPPPSSRWSHAVEAAGWLHVTGQLPTDPDAPDAPIVSGIIPQAEMCFVNLSRILKYAEYDFCHTVFARIYLNEFERDFAAFNSVYAKFFPDDQPLPSCTTIGVAALGRGALVEIDFVCFRRY